MDYDDIEQITEPLDEHWAQRMGDSVYRLVSPVWEGSILPSLRAKALRSECTAEEFRDMWIRSMSLAIDLFEALHIGAYFEGAPEEEKPRFLWCHQSFDLLRANDKRRGFDIGKDELLRVAAEYLSHPEIRCNYFDWLLLDSIVFAELDAFGYHVLSTRAGTGFNLAAAVADGNLVKYQVLSLLLGVLGFALRYLAAPAVSIFLASKGHEIASLTVAGLWVLNLVWTLIGFPARRKMRKKGAELLTSLNDLYQILGNSTISPRILKESLDKAVAAGVVLDGAVFTIVDRMVARDATAFIATQAG
ncbi:hypothetical protein [Paraburkholderia sediminicola]|uniref:hypothetical protein n=1 Tax=Paraburkholderia sediminicola TaxID=458836 RepID=UPI0038B870A3